MPSTHLLVLIHGMWGNPDHLAEMRRVIAEKYANQDDPEVTLSVLVAQTNSNRSTYDGIDWGGERIVDEVMSKIEDIESDGTTKVTRFSVVGYSLGGLLARYLIGVLRTRQFFERVQPVNFTSFATPHFGIPRHGGFRAFLAKVGPYLLARTGEHFYAVDQWGDTGRPLLEVMADKDRVFYQALAQFPRVDIYANAVDDTTVPYVTSALEATDPFMAHETNGIEIQFDETYEPLIKSFHLPPSPPPPPPKPPIWSPKFFHQLKPKRPLLPPAFQFRFPMNILFNLLIPVILPLFIVAVAINLGLDARASRARIKMLEKDPSSRDKLVNILRSIENDEADDDVANKVDEVVVDILGGPSATESDVVVATAKQRAPRPSVVEPVLTPTQKTVLASLNSLPQLKKHLAFIHPVRNSHAVLVSRDMRFPLHKRGEGILRHWADNFEL